MLELDWKDIGKTGSGSIDSRDDRPTFALGGVTQAMRKNASSEEGLSQKVWLQQLRLIIAGLLGCCC